MHRREHRTSIAGVPSLANSMSNDYKAWNGCAHQQNNQRCLCLHQRSGFRISCAVSARTLRRPESRIFPSRHRSKHPVLFGDAAKKKQKKNLNCNKGFLHRQFFLFLRVFPLDEVFPRSPPWPCRTRRDLHSAWVSLRAPRELQGIQVPPTVRSSSKARSSEARTQTQRRSARLFGASTRASSKSAG